MVIEHLFKTELFDCAFTQFTLKSNLVVLHCLILAKHFANICYTVLLKIANFSFQRSFFSVRYALNLFENGHGFQSRKCDP